MDYVALTLEQHEELVALGEEGEPEKEVNKVEEKSVGVDIKKQKA